MNTKEDQELPCALSKLLVARAMLSAAEVRDQAKLAMDLQRC